MFLRKYGTGTGADVYVPLIKRGVVDFAVSGDFTPASGDVKISIDGGAAANIGTLPTAVSMGNTAYWKFVFADAELQGKVIVVTVADSATKAVEDQAFVVETYGHASAKFAADLSLANLPANVTQWRGNTPANLADTDKVPASVQHAGANTINASALATDAVTEIQSGLATSAEVATVAGYIDTEIAAILSAVDTEVAAIKAKTDQLSFISDRVRSIAF